MSSGGPRRELVGAIVVLILAGSLAVLIILYGIYVLVYGQSLAPPASTTLATAVGGILGILGAYIGGRHSGEKPPPEQPPGEGQQGSPRKEGESA